MLLLQQHKSSCRDYSPVPGVPLRQRLKKIIACIIRLLFPSALLAIHEKGLRRKLQVLFKHELQAHATPLKLSLSLSIGVVMAIFPVHGLQVLLLLLLTTLLPLNRPVAMVGVSISSAPFLPFWIAAGVGVGEMVLPDAFVTSTASLLETSLPAAVLAWVRNLPVQGMLDGVVRWFFGSMVLAVFCGVLSFVLSYPVIRNVGRFSENGTPAASHRRVSSTLR